MKTRKDYLPEVKRRCEEHEVDFDRLAKKDIDEIIGEIKAEENGDAILDGWFYSESALLAKYKKGTD